MATLPHERERMFLDDIIDDCLKGRNKLVLVIASRSDEVNFLANETRRIAEGLKPFQSKSILIYRERLKFIDTGAEILFKTYNNPSSLHSLSPDRIVLMGSWGEFWYSILGMTAGGARIEAVA